MFALPLFRFLFPVDLLEPGFVFVTERLAPPAGAARVRLLDDVVMALHAFLSLLYFSLPENNSNVSLFGAPFTDPL